MSPLPARLADGRDVWVPKGPALKFADLREGDQLWLTKGFPHSLTVLRENVAIGWVDVELSGTSHAKYFKGTYGLYAVVSDETLVSPLWEVRS